MSLKMGKFSIWGGGKRMASVSSVCAWMNQFFSADAVFKQTFT